MEKIKPLYINNYYNHLQRKNLKQQRIGHNPKNEIIGSMVCLCIGVILFFWGQSRMDYALSCANNPYIYYDPSAISAVYDAGSFLRFFGIVFLVGGIFGLVYGAVLKQKQTKLEVVKSESKRFCPKCGRDIPFDSVVCPYCQYDFK